jgi:hypothetical protein
MRIVEGRRDEDDEDVGESDARHPASATGPRQSGMSRRCSSTPYPLAALAFDVGPGVDALL